MTSSSLLASPKFRQQSLRGTATMYLSRNQSEIPATEALTPTQIDVLRAITKQLKLKVDLPKLPNVRQAMLAVAELGCHVKYRGNPGWLVLGRGLEKLLIAELGWRAHAAQS